MTVENFTTAKLYIKGTVWIKWVYFNDITDAWYYMLGITDKNCQAEVIEDLF